MDLPASPPNMGLMTLDLLARGGAIALFVLWAAVLWQVRRSAPAARVGVALCLSILAYLAAPLLLPWSALGFTLCDAASVLAPALLWLFARVWFEDRARIGPRSRAIVIGYALVPLIQIVLLLTTGRISFALWGVARIGMFALALSAMWIAWRGRADDLIEPRRVMRLVLVGVIAGFTLWVSALEALHSGWPQLDRAHTLTIVAVFAATLAASVAMYGFRPIDLFAAPSPPRVPSGGLAPASPSPLAIRLQKLMVEERAYRAEGFAIAALSGRIGEPEYRVRRTINGELGFRNFTAFLNSYRLDEVREALADPAQREVPILTIALDAGFGSLGPFNRAFREAEGMTPSEYRALKLADSGIG